MSDLNKVIMVGRLVRDPELRHAGQTPKCEFRLATSREYTSNNEKKKDTCYVDVQVWGRSAEACKRYLTQGSQVCVEGRLQFEEWEKDGQRRSKHSINAMNVQFLGGGANRDNQGAPSPQPQPAAVHDDDVPF